MNNINLLPHDDRIVIKDIVHKLQYIKLMIQLLKNFCIALALFKKNELIFFDAQVGETLCQIRAYKIFSLFNSFSKGYLDIDNFINILKNLIEKLYKNQEIYQNLLKLPKKERPTFAKEPISLTDFFSEMKCIIPISENNFYIFITYFLSRHNEVDENQIPIRIDYASIEKTYNLSKTYSKKVVHFYQKMSSQLSCKYIFDLAEELPGKEYLRYILPLVYKTSDEGRMVLPCYTVTEIIVLHMIAKEIKLVLLIDINFDERNERIAFCFQGSRKHANFLLLSEQQLNTNKYDPCIVMYGQSYPKHPFFKTIFLQEVALYGGIKNLILFNNAAHPQYSGKTLSAFKNNPFELIKKDTHNQSFNIWSLSKKLSAELEEKKLNAEYVGCTETNPSFFLLKHIFCNRIDAYSSYYQNNKFSLNENKNKLLLRKPIKND